MNDQLPGGLGCVVRELLHGKQTHILQLLGQT